LDKGEEEGANQGEEEAQSCLLPEAHEKISLGYQTEGEEEEASILDKVDTLDCKSQYNEEECVLARCQEKFI
jgi:hypothetical protein